MNPHSKRPLYPLFLADWSRALFIHYEVDPGILAPEVPYPLDLHEDRAWISLVAFELERMRLVRRPRFTESLFRPIATTRFLNVRTYVRYRDEPGIFFLAEFVSNPLSVPLGPPAFGLPYRGARLDFHHEQLDRLQGCVGQGHSDHEIRYTAKVTDRDAPVLRDFLLERYTAFTIRDNQRGRFRVAHGPWEARPVDLELHDDRLLDTTGSWHSHAKCHSAHFSPGIRDVRMGSFRFADE